MPYISAFKEDITYRKDYARNENHNDAERQGQHKAAASFCRAASPSAGRQADSHNDSLFAYLRDVHQAEAQEFRRKGHNAQIPALNPTLVAQLREALAGAQQSGVLASARAGRSDAEWRQRQLAALDKLTARLSDNAQRWIDHQLGAVHGDPKYDAKNRAAAQQLAGRLASALRTLKNAVDVLFPADGGAVMPDGDIARVIRALHSEAEKDREIAPLLSATACSFFSELAEYFTSLGTRLSSDRPQAAGIDPASVRRLHDAVTDARAQLNHGISTAGPFDAPWMREKLSAIAAFAARLSEDNVRRWISHEKAIKNADSYLSLIMPLTSAMQTLTDITEELLTPGKLSGFSTFGVLLKNVGHQAGIIADIVGQRQGSLADFFRDVSQFLENLHREMKDKSVRQTSSPPDWFKKKGAQCAILLAEASTLRAGLHGKLLDVVPPLNPAMASERLTAESIVRSILWSWQQMAIKTRDASSALYAKTKVLYAIQDRVLPAPASHDGENREDNDAVADSAAVQQRTSDGGERKKSASVLSEKMAELDRLLTCDIGRAAKINRCLATGKDGIANSLEKQALSVYINSIDSLSESVSRDLWSACEKLTGAFMYDIAERLAAAGSALNKAIIAAGDREPHYHEAKERSEESLLLATQVEKTLAAAAAKLTGRTLDEYSRGARLARHWAEIARQKMPEDWVEPNAEQVSALLKKHRLTDDVLSAGDPQGFLFATRLAAEFENARIGELKPPISPEQYAGLEKGLAEYLAKWGQRKISDRAARIAVDLSLDALGYLTIGLSDLTGMVFRAGRACIKIPWSLHKLNKHIMPGSDIPYGAVCDLLEKKLTQLGFSVLISPVPGMIKLAAGGALVAGAGVINYRVGTKENTFDAIYGRVTTGKKSQHINMDSGGQMLSDLVLSGTAIAGFKGATGALKAGANVPGAQVREYPEWHPASEEQRRHDVMMGSGAGRQTPVSGTPTDAAEQKLPAAAEAEAFAGSGDSEEAHQRSRGKRSLEAQDATAGASTGQSLRADQVDFTPQEAWKTFTDDKKKTTYLYGIKQVLCQIESDQSLSPRVRKNAHLARIGAPLVVPADIAGYQLNNTFLLPDPPGSKSGVLVRLDSAQPYYYVSKGNDLLANIKWAFPHDANERKRKTRLPFTLTTIGGAEFLMYENAQGFLSGLRDGTYDFNDYFNRNNPSAVNIASLSSALASTIENDYKLKGKTPENKLLITRAILGALIPDPAMTTTLQKYKLQITWESLTPAEYLRSFARPFSTLSGQTQLVVSDITGQTVQQTAINVDKAEYIGSWFDVSVGAVTSFTSGGIVLSAVQAAAEIAANVADGEQLDPLAVAALTVRSISGGSIAVKLGKFSLIGGTTVKYALMVADKAVDLATVGQSIKQAYETGEPLAIYQALLTSGMSVKHSYDMAKNIAAQMKLSKPMEASASLEALEEIASELPVHTVESNQPVRSFKIGNTALQGKINAGEFMISRDNRVSWEKGNRLQLLAYKVRNVDGGRQLPEADVFTQTNAPDADTSGRAGAGERNAFGEDLDFSLIDKAPGETEKALQRFLFSAGPHADSLKRFRDNPWGYGYEAMLKTFNVLKAKGLNPRVVGMLVYKNPHDTGPENHYAVRIARDGADFVIDPTIRQFDPGFPDSATVLPYAEWESFMKEAAGTGVGHFILLKEFAGPLSARRVVSDIQSSMGKFYQSAMIQESNVNILNINIKFKNFIIEALENRKNALSKLKTSGKNSKHIQKDIENLKKLKTRFNLLSPGEIRPSEKVGNKIKRIPSSHTVADSDIDAIEAGQDSSSDIISTVTGRHYLKIGKNVWLEVEQGKNKNKMRIIHQGLKDIAIRFDKKKKKWRVADYGKMSKDTFSGSGTVKTTTGAGLKISEPLPASDLAGNNGGLLNISDKRKTEVSQTKDNRSHEGVLDKDLNTGVIPTSHSAEKSPNDDGQTYPVYSGLFRHPDTSFDRTTVHRVTLNKVSEFVLKTKFGWQKAQVFDASTGKYTDSSDFMLTRTGFTVENERYLSSQNLYAAVEDMKNTSYRLTGALSQYSGPDKSDILDNLQVIKQALEDISKSVVPDNTVPDITTYALMKNRQSYYEGNTYYGLANVHFDVAQSDLSVRYLIAHPYVVVNKYSAFRDYLIKQGLVSAEMLANYNIKNVARYLGAHILNSELKFHNSIPGTKVKSISFYSANPITQHLGYSLERFTRLLSLRQSREGNRFDYASPDVLSQHQLLAPYQEGLDDLRTQVRDEFNPVRPVEVISDEATEKRITRLMHDYQAEIISENLLLSRRLGESRELREFSQEVIKSIKKAFIKVSQVKSLFDEADSRPEIKAELKRMLNEATGLNDDKTIEIDKKDITAISNMVYDRFKENLVGVYSFLSSQITHNYTAFNVIEYKQFDSFKPDAFALPYDRQQRILLAMLPETLRHGGMTDTVIHEASHNAAATLDHTYIGNIRAESGSFPRSFQQSAREDSHFFADDRISKLSATYALGLPASAVITPQQELTARGLIECSKLVKADTLLNAAEYITYIIDVLSRHHIQGSRIWPNEGTSRPKRNDDARNHRLELTIIEAVLGLSLH